MKKKQLCSIFKAIIEHLARWCAIWILIIAPADIFKSLFAHKYFPRTLFLRQYLFRRLLKLILLEQRAEWNLLHIVLFLEYFELVCKVISVLVEVVFFTMLNVDTFCKYEINTVLLRPFDKEDWRFVVLKSDRSTNLSVWMFNDFFVEKNKEIVFWFCELNLVFGFRKWNL